MKSHHRVTVKKSPIHGRGLFADEFIEKDSVIGYCKTAETDDEEGIYTLFLDSGPVEVLCDIKYINHSKEPNVALYDDLSVVALRDIAPFEELTHDYGEGWE